MYISDTKVYYDKLIEHDLSILEYCVADYIYKLSNTAGNTKGGYCYMSKESIAKAFNISERTIYRIINRLRSKSVLEKDDNCLKIINWSTKGNYYYIRHKLIEEIKTSKLIKAYNKEKDQGLVLSMEEYAIMDMALNYQASGQKIKLKEIQRRLNCSKMSMNTYMKKINSYPAVGYLNGRFFIKDLYLSLYFDTTAKKELDDKIERYGPLYDSLFDENGNEL